MPSIEELEATQIIQKKKAPTVEFGCLNPLEVVVGWDLLFASIKGSGLYATNMQVARILCDAMAGKLQVWIFKHKDEDGTRHLDGVIVTQMYMNPYLDRKTLCIMHAHTVQSVSQDDWTRAYATVSKYAKGEDCQMWEVYTDNPRAQNLLYVLGFERIGLYRKEV